jgi:phosphopantothenoylcysteine decarboxylase/phosphopantothenate--cysteine ligase
MTLIGPGEGSQACGETGAGRMLEPMELVDALSALFCHGALQGVHVLITAGPTREAIDPVRYISNKSSGRMGFALAQAAFEAHAQVTLVSGPVTLPTPKGVSRIDVESAEQMYAAVMQSVSGAQIFIACAAVADYRAANSAQHKIKKSSNTLLLELVRTPDIVTCVANLDSPPFILGFAAETQDLKKHALAKLEKKSLNMIAANRVGLPNSGFDSEYNALEVLWQNGHESLSRARKGHLARKLIKLLAERYAAIQSDSVKHQQP